MKREDIIRMAREAGFVLIDSIHEDCAERFAALVAASKETELNDGLTIAYMHGYEKGKDAGAAAEREACAKVCDDIDTEYEGEDVLATWCAAAIRARGQE